MANTIAREVEVPVKESPELLHPLPSEEEVEKFISAFKTVNLRGTTFDRFQIPDLDPNVYVEWHRPDPDTHDRLTRLGFVRDDELGAKAAFTNRGGDGAVRIHDVVCYRTAAWKKPLMDKIIAGENLKAMQNTGEETAWIDNMVRDGIMPRHEGPTIQNLTRTELEQAIKQSQQ